MNLDCIDKNAIATTVRKRMEEISIGLMNAENKNYCLASVNINDWKLFHIDCTGDWYVAVPSPAFNRFIFRREYLKVVDAFPTHFGTNNDWEVLRAIKNMTNVC